MNGTEARIADPISTAMIRPGRSRCDVRFWAMQPERDEFSSDDEVDETRWEAVEADVAAVSGVTLMRRRHEPATVPTRIGQSGATVASIA